MHVAPHKAALHNWNGLLKNPIDPASGFLISGTMGYNLHGIDSVNPVKFVKFVVYYL